MSFIIRQIAKRADGGDIIRTRTIETPELTIGRGTDCDIQLADLGIMLRHARLIQLPGLMVAVEATGGIPLEIDGKFVNRADLRVADRPQINMASHRLSLEPGDAPGSVNVTAERVIAASDSADASAETEIFSLRGALPSKRILAWGLAALVLLLGLALPLFGLVGSKSPLPPAMVADAARPASNQTLTPARTRLQPVLDVTAPGPQTAAGPDVIWTSGRISDAHAGIANECSACHVKAFQATPDSGCASCHVPAALPDHAAPARMAKGMLVKTGMGADIRHAFGLNEGRCADCHKEHEGPNGALMVRSSFCTDCHTGLSSRLADTGLANVESWEKHPQFSPNLVVRASDTQPKFQRVSLDTKPSEASGLVYPHELHMSRTNAVANMALKQGLPAKDGALGCNYCHTPDSDKVRFKPIEMEKNCGACHDLGFARDGGVLRTLPHGKPAQVAGIVRDFYLSQALSPRANVQRIAFERRAPGRMAEAEAQSLRITSVAEARTRAGAAIDAIFSENGVCADCHVIGRTASANPAERWQVAPVTLADHYLARGRFPHGRHDSYNGKTGDQACIACHTGVTRSKLATDVLLPKVSQCGDCHGSSDVKTNVAATCDTCHGFHGSGDGSAPATAAPASVTIAGRKLPRGHQPAVASGASAAAGGSGWQGPTAALAPTRAGPTG